MLGPPEQPTGSLCAHYPHLLHLPSSTAVLPPMQHHEQTQPTSQKFKPKHVAESTKFAERLFRSHVTLCRGITRHLHKGATAITPILPATTIPSPRVWPLCYYLQPIDECPSALVPVDVLLIFCAACTITAPHFSRTPHIESTTHTRHTQAALVVDVWDSGPLNATWARHVA